MGGTGPTGPKISSKLEPKYFSRIVFWGAVELTESQYFYSRVQCTIFNGVDTIVVDTKKTILDQI